MTNQEKIIVSAYTGILMCDFGQMVDCISKKLGRSIFTHELATEEVCNEVKAAFKEDFLAICDRTTILSADEKQVSILEELIEDAGAMDALDYISQLKQEVSEVTL